MNAIALENRNLLVNMTNLGSLFMEKDSKNQTRKLQNIMAFLMEIVLC